MPFLNCSIASSAQSLKYFILNVLKCSDTLELEFVCFFFLAFGGQLYTQYLTGRKVLELLMSHGLFLAKSSNQVLLFSVFFKLQKLLFDNVV